MYLEHYVMNEEDGEKKVYTQNDGDNTLE